MQVVNEQTVNLISTSEIGALSNGICSAPFFSNDGNYIGFFSESIDYQTEIATGIYQLIIKNIQTQVTQIPNLLGNGVCEHIHPTYENTELRIASYSPDSTKIAFFTNSSNLIPSDTSIIQFTPTIGYRWYIYDLLNDTISRVGYNGTDYGNYPDVNELLWLNNDRIVFVSYSNNLVSGVNINDYHQEVYLKTLSTDSVELVSRKETGNIAPFFTYGSFNIAVNLATNKVSFFSQEYGFCIKDLTTTSLTRVQDLPEISDYGIVLANFFNFNLDGTKALLKINAGNTTFPFDDNNKDDEFIYDFDTSTVIIINDNGIGIGDGSSEKSTFSPNGLNVAFICNSMDIDINNTNDVKNLYVKNISTGNLTRISIPIGGGNLSNDVIDYSWIDDNNICFSTYENNLVVGDSNNYLDLFIRYTLTSTTKRINVNTSGNYQFTVTELYKNTFSNNQICFSALIEDIADIDNTIGYDRHNIFVKVFDDISVTYPNSEVLAYAVDSINATVNNSKADAYTYIDSIAGTPTLSVIGSAYVERVNSIQYKNDLSNVRWMSINYPVTFNDTPIMKIGGGIFQATPTLLDDIIELKQNVIPANIGSLYGTMFNIVVDSQFDIVILSAGENQYSLCAPPVYLEASIRGNVAGHTFLWELIDGTSVPAITLEQNSQTQAHYQASPSTTDLVFRYWIDKGKPNQQYKDVIVYATPASISPQISASSNIRSNIDNPNLFIAYSNANINFDYTISWNSSGVYSSTLMEEWGLPHIFYNTNNTDSENVYLGYYDSSIIQRHNGVDWITLDEKSINEIRQYYPINDGDIIRVGARYKRPGHEEYESYYNLPEYVVPNLFADNVMGEFNGSSNILNHTVTNISYTFTTLLEDTLTEMKATSGLNNYTKISITYESEDSPEDTIIQYSGSSNTTYLNITRIYGGSIGG